MKLLLLAATISFAMISHVPAYGQSFLGKTEGSRPGETYRAGKPDPERQQQQQQMPAQYQQPFQTQYPSAQPQYQMNPAIAPQQLQTHAESKSAIGSGKPVIMEFSDLQCPDSARYNRELKDTIMQRYVRNGKASYEWHDFPLPSHADAPEAAAAARCAGASADRMRQQIMRNQGQMSANVYMNYARQLGVEENRFGTCLREGSSRRDVSNDQALGKSLGVRGTPTLVLGMADSRGRVSPVKLVKAYDPPQQVLAEIDDFLAGDQTEATPTAPAAMSY